MRLFLLGVAFGVVVCASLGLYPPAKKEQDILDEEVTVIEVTPEQFDQLLRGNNIVQDLEDLSQDLYGSWHEN